MFESHGQARLPSSRFSFGAAPASEVNGSLSRPSTAGVAARSVARDVARDLGAPMSQFQGHARQPSDQCVAEVASTCDVNTWVSRPSTAGMAARSVAQEAAHDLGQGPGRARPHLSRPVPEASSACDIIAWGSRPSTVAVAMRSVAHDTARGLGASITPEQEPPRLPSCRLAPQAASACDVSCWGSRPSTLGVGAKAVAQEAALDLGPSVCQGVAHAPGRPAPPAMSTCDINTLESRPSTAGAAAWSVAHDVARDLGASEVHVGGSRPSTAGVRSVARQEPRDLAQPISEDPMQAGLPFSRLVPEAGFASEVHTENSRPSTAGVRSVAHEEASDLGASISRGYDEARLVSSLLVFEPAGDVRSQGARPGATSVGPQPVAEEVDGDMEAPGFQSSGQARSCASRSAPQAAWAPESSARDSRPSTMGVAARAVANEAARDFEASMSASQGPKAPECIVSPPAAPRPHPRPTFGGRELVRREIESCNEHQEASRPDCGPDYMMRTELNSSRKDLAATIERALFDLRAQRHPEHLQGIRQRVSAAVFESNALELDGAVLSGDVVELMRSANSRVSEACAQACVQSVSKILADGGTDDVALFSAVSSTVAQVGLESFRRLLDRVSTWPLGAADLSDNVSAEVRSTSARICDAAEAHSESAEDFVVHDAVALPVALCEADTQMDSGAQVFPSEGAAADNPEISPVAPCYGQDPPSADDAECPVLGGQKSANTSDAAEAPPLARGCFDDRSQCSGSMPHTRPAEVGASITCSADKASDAVPSIKKKSHDTGPVVGIPDGTVVNRLASSIALCSGDNPQRTCGAEVPATGSERSGSKSDVSEAPSPAQCFDDRSHCSGSMPEMRPAEITASVTCPADKSNDAVGSSLLSRDMHLVEESADVVDTDACCRQVGLDDLEDQGCHQPTDFDEGNDGRGDELGANSPVDLATRRSDACDDDSGLAVKHPSNASPRAPGSNAQTISPVQDFERRRAVSASTARHAPPTSATSFASKHTDYGRSTGMPSEVFGSRRPRDPPLQYEISYPELPSILRCGEWYRFSARLFCKDRGRQVQARLVGSQLRFWISPALPAGLILCDRSGDITGMSQAEVASTTYEITAHIGDRRHTHQSVGVCALQLQVTSAPVGLTYPAVETIIEMGGAEPLPPELRLGRKGQGQVAKDNRNDTWRLLRSLLPMPHFEADPVLKAGLVDRFEITPDLPKGMTLNERTGRISGVPDHRFPAFFRHTFEVFGHNAVGVSACKVLIEVIAGHWNLATVKLRTVDPTEARKDSKRSEAPLAPWLARACAGPRVAEVDWSSVLDKVAALLDRCGRDVRITDLGGSVGNQLVKGLTMGALLPMLGMRDDMHKARKLIRIVEQQGQAHRHYPHKTTASACRGAAASVAVATKHCQDIADVVVYLRKRPSIAQDAEGVPEVSGIMKAAAVRHWDHTIGSWPSPCTATAQQGKPPTSRELASGAEDAAAKASRVNEEFSKLLPHWRSKLKEDKPRLRQEAVVKWRSRHV